MRIPQFAHWHDSRRVSLVPSVPPVPPVPPAPRPAAPMTVNLTQIAQPDEDAALMAAFAAGTAAAFENLYQRHKGGDRTG